TATVLDVGEPASGRDVTFRILDGPHAGLEGAVSTDADGQAEYSYTGWESGVDRIEDSFVDADGRTQTSDRAVITWPNTAPVLSAVGPHFVGEGHFAVVYVTAVDAEMDRLTYRWDLDGSGRFERVGRSTIFSAESLDGPSSHVVSVRVCDDLGACATATVPIEVVNVAPFAMADTAEVDEDGPAVAIDVLSNDADAAGPRDPLSVTGVDASETTGLVTFTASNVSYEPNGQFEWLAAGETAVDTFEYEIDDGDGGAASAAVSVTVHGRNDGPNVAADAAAVTVDEGGVATNTGTFSDVDESDSVAVSASVGTIVQDSGSSGVWSWSLQTTDGPADSQTVTVTADDGLGGVATTTFDLAVDNVAPTVLDLNVPTDPIALGDQSSHSVTVSFSDPADTADEPFVCSFDMDSDGTTDATVSDVSGSECSATLAYDAPGVYLITATVTDKDGGAATISATAFAVIYDAEGGFVTGGGWITSPPGAYVAEPTLTGKATFGFVSKYKQGASTPEGNTEFQFKAGDLNFHASDYQWLVIAGKDKAKYKGTGTINGVGRFGFMLTAKDGDAADPVTADTFRIKIWDEDDGDALVYDNKIDSDDDSYDGTELGGGNIKVHKP
ncbi:MAG: Ig-like domain-containing protein, partial [Anaerolineae bacterium]